MKTNSTIVLKRVLRKGDPLSRVHLQTVVGDLPSRKVPFNSDGFIGKVVPLSPTFLGIFILNQYYSRKNSNQLEKDLPSFLKGGKD